MTLLPLHVAAGAVALVSGAMALAVLKGGRLHRRSGMIFVVAMLVMASTGTLVAAINNNRGNVMGGALACYLVITGFLAVRRRAPHMEIPLTMAGACIGILGVTWGLAAVHSGTGRLDGYPPALYFIFATVALLSAAGDLRTIYSPPIGGTPRVVRHLWRMCFALFIATGSFFLGQAQVFPKPIRILPLLAVPAVLPLVLMLFWVARARSTTGRPFP